MDFRNIRTKFLDFFRERDHEIVTSASLIPRDDPSLLFINSGMAPFKRLFLGEENRGYTRAADSQKCVRAGGKHNDLDNVGFTARHHTFFEMLGNFSFGDYFKIEAITWAWELLTEGYGLPADRLYVSVYRDDDEAYRIWQDRIGVPAERIVRLGEQDNFWTMGDTGPCGPCSEILLDQGPELACDRPDCAPGCDCDRYLEIWNLVFTQFDRQPDGTMEPLPKPNIDTGMGLERLAAVVQGVYSNYETDIFKDLIAHIEDLSEKPYGANARHDVAFRVISDHARATAFLIGDGIMPSNEGRGYVLRRIIRRALRFGQTLDLKDVFLRPVCTKVIQFMGKDYPELVQSRSFIEGVVQNEEQRFADTLSYAMQVVNEEISKLKAAGNNTIPGQLAFKLYDTYGFSLDILQDVAREENLQVDTAGYENAMSHQRKQSQKSWKGSGQEEVPEIYRTLLLRGLNSRFAGYENLQTSSRVTALLVDGREVDSARAGGKVEVVLDETPFYGRAGGQVGDTGWLNGGNSRVSVSAATKIDEKLIVHKGELETGTLRVGDQMEARVDEEKRKATARNHSATHLLHTALREILGGHVKQAGSLVSPERLRFDFSHFTQVSADTLLEVERLVNRYVRENLAVETQEMSKEKAFETGATAIFEERYGDTVRLVSMGDGISRELCGGTHTERTGDIGLFHILSEGAVAANIRRIEAVTGETALEHDQKQLQDLRFAAELLKTAPDQLRERLPRLLEELKNKDREISALKAKMLSKKTEHVLSEVQEIAGIQVLALEIDAESAQELRESADRLKDRLGSGVVLVGAKRKNKAMLTCGVTKDLTARFKAGEIIKQLSPIVGGKGGGRPDMAQGGGGKPERLAEALAGISGLIAKRAE